MAPAVYLNTLGITCALGNDVTSVRSALYAATPGGVRPSAGPNGRQLCLGRVTADTSGMSELPIPFRSRNNALLLATLKQLRGAVDDAVARYGAHRVGVVIGTSTSGVAEGEAGIALQVATGKLPANYDVAQQEMGSPAMALATLLQLAGPAHVVSTACSSSAKAIASGARLLRAGMCDAVIVGGMDALCDFVITGFSALDSVSPERCNPLSRNRCGINLGEGGALFLMSREPGPVLLAGWGESSDAHHISAPAPDGRGALDSMRQALRRAQLDAGEIDYINLHGTATPQNDAMECLAIDALFGCDVAVSSTKPLTGHALGGAGALECALCWLALVDNPAGRMPPHWWDGERDPALPAVRIAEPGSQLGRPMNYALSNSFAFGGSNATLILARSDESGAFAGGA